MSEENKNNIGDNNTFIGNVPSGNYGNGNTIIGATDNYGNTIINQPGAIGYNAKAGPGSIAIGAYAGSGSDIFFLLNNLEVIAKQTGINSSSDISNLIQELKTPIPDKTKIQKLWQNIQAIKWTTEAVVLIHQIYNLIQPFVK
jgi:hypothetical protein